MKRPVLLAMPFLLCLSQSADAHLVLTSHDARYGAQQKAGPCGLADGERTTDKVYIAKPGTQVMLTWDETVNHPSFYRIDFDLDGDDGFVDPILPCADQTSIADCFDTTNTGPYMVNNIPDDPAKVQSYMYTLPDVECDNCTLQVVQAMHDKAPFTLPGDEMYYQCLDIVLDNNGPDVLTLLEDGAGPGDAGVDGDSDAAPVSPSGDAGMDTDNGQGPVGGGCQSSGSSQGVIAALFALVLLGVRRRQQGLRARSGAAR